MPRTYAQILSSIWAPESDFRTLDESTQRLYFFLLSQPNLNHAGLLTIAPRRWAATAGGLTVELLNDRLAVLAERRYIVIDWDTDELLIRTFVRNDGTWRQPRVMGAMASDAGEIESTKLRRALLAELDRIDLEDLSDAPGKNNAPSVRSEVARHIQAVRQMFGQGSPKASPDAPSGVSDTPDGAPADTCDEGSDDGVALPSTRVRAHAPSPTPSPTPKTGGAEAPGADKPRTPSKSGKQQTETDRLADEITRRWWDERKAAGNAPAQAFPAARSVVRTALGNGVGADELRSALPRISAQGFAISGGTIETALGQLRRTGQRAPASSKPPVPTAATRATSFGA